MSTTLSAPVSAGSNGHSGLVPITIARNGSAPTPPSPASPASPPAPPPASSSAATAAPYIPGRPREHVYRLAAFLVYGDWLTATAGIFSGLALREWLRSLAHLPSEPFSQLIPTLGMWSLIGGVAFTLLLALFGTYEQDLIYRTQRWLRSMIISSVLLMTGAWAVIGLFQITGFSPRIGVIYALGALMFFSTLWRLSAFMFLMRPSVREAASKRVIVIGWNDLVANLRRAMRRDLAQLGEIVGCVPLRGKRFRTPPPKDLAILGDYARLAEHVRNCRADSIILADQSAPPSEIEYLIAYCQREMLGFQMVPGYFPALNSGLQVDVVSGVPLLSVSHLPLDRAPNRMMKRLVDIIGGSVGMLAAGIAVPLFGAIVYAQSPGPIIYRQLRTSRNGRTFYIYKIRSMKMHAEAASGAVWCTKDDPRRLRIGTFMRKYNVDEIPQFWNVLKGDMSLVGPRPERPELIAKFKEQIPNYNARHEVRAGITGWAQVNGLRGDTDLSKRIEADLYYLENWSLLLDFYCMFATFFRNKNAA